MLLALGIIFILFGLLYFVIKLMVVYSHDPGGVPILDGYIFPPIALGMGSACLFRHFGIAGSGLLVGLISFAIVCAGYAIAWRFGARQKR